jgi:hypothetical protein
MNNFKIKEFKMLKKSKEILKFLINRINHDQIISNIDNIIS